MMQQTRRGSLGEASARRAVPSVTEAEDGMSDITDEDSNMGAPKKLDAAFETADGAQASSMAPPAPRVPKKVRGTVQGDAAESAVPGVDHS